MPRHLIDVADLDELLTIANEDLAEWEGALPEGDPFGEAEAIAARRSLLHRLERDRLQAAGRSGGTPDRTGGPVTTPDSATLLVLREEALELAQARGLPADTIAAAGMAAQYVDEGRPVVLRGLSLGNRTGLDLALVPLSASTGLPSGTAAGYVLVAPVGWTSYAFDRLGYLAGSYVAEHLRPPSGRGNPCDGSALALVLGLVLGRPAIVQCDCEIHRDPLA